MNLRCDDHPERHRLRLPSTVMIFTYAENGRQKQKQERFLDTQRHFNQMSSMSMLLKDYVKFGKGDIMVPMHQRMAALQ